MTVQFTEADEHLLSRLEVEILRGLEEQYDAEATKRLEAYCVAVQTLTDVVTEAVAIGGEPMRIYLQAKLTPLLEHMEATYHWLNAGLEE
jgi:hypothetical protein